MKGGLGCKRSVLPTVLKCKPHSVVSTEQGVWESKRTGQLEQGQRRLLS